MNLQQAKQAFQQADHELQLAWGNGDPTLMVAAKKRRNKAYNLVAKLVKQNMA